MPSALELFSSEPVAFILRFVVGALFLTAGLAKLTYLEEFKKILSQAGIPAGRSPQVARIVVSAEIILGSLLIVGLLTKVVAAVSVVVLAVFTAFVVNALIKRQHLECGCFGKVAQGKLSLFTVLRNLALMVLAVFILGAPNPHVTASNYIPHILVNGSLLAVALLVSQFLAMRGLFISVPVVSQQGVTWIWLNKHFMRAK